MSHSRYALVLARSAAIGITSAPLLAQSPVALSENQQEVLFKQPGYSPYVGRNYPTQVFWGDQHVHSGWSVDTGTSGTRLTPEDAVRFSDEPLQHHLESNAAKFNLP